MLEINLLPQQNTFLKKFTRKRVLVTLIMTSCLLLCVLIAEKIPQPKKTAKKFQQQHRSLKSHVIASPVAAIADVLLNDDNESATSELSSTPFYLLKMVGSWSDDQAQFALLALPDGKTVSVQKGDVVGVEHGRVLQVSEHHIQVVIQHKLLQREVSYA